MSDACGPQPSITILHVRRLVSEYNRLEVLPSNYPVEDLSVVQGNSEWFYLLVASSE